MGEYQRTVRLVAVAASLLMGCSDGPSPRPSLPMPPTPSTAGALPPFSVAGGVVDTAYRSLTGTRVEIVSGPKTGTFAIVGEDGTYSLPGPFTDFITLLASMDGHISQTKTIPSHPVVHHAEGAQFQANFQLERVGPSADLTGVYSMTLTLDSTCNLLPEHARTRSYTATVVRSQPPTSFQATLSDARFLEEMPCPPGRSVESCTHNRFNLYVAGDVAGIGSGFVERIDESGHLVVWVAGTGTIGPLGIMAPLAGELYFCPSEPSYLIDQGAWTCQPGTGAWCSAPNHQLTLLRR